MKMTHLFSQTLREAPAEAEVASHKLLLRAGFIRQLASGVFSYLPLAKRSLTKIENVMRSEMNAIDGQEVTMPVVHPAEIWKETKRWYEIGSEMGRFKDKTGRDMALAMTHEEVIGDLIRKEVRSYRQLPALLYHIQTKWRDDPRPRAGLIRAREFTMKDSYSLDADWEGLDKQYRAHYQAYFNIFNRCALPTIAVLSDVGMMGGSMAHEYMYLTPIGEDTLLLCKACGYSANRQIARFKKEVPPEEKAKPIEKVSTPGASTIEELADFLGVPKSRTAKAVFMVATIAQGQDQSEQFVFAIVRGDMDVNETKLANAVKAKELRSAREDEIRSVGAEPGYASPVGLKNALIVVDDLIPNSPNLVAGANEAGYHFRNVNYGRDYQADIITDIAAADQDSPCPNCGAPMNAVRGVEVGNIFKLGTRYTEAMGCTFLDQDGQTKPVIMGSYGIGSPRLLACIAEEHHDDQGLAWPITVSPFHVHMITLKGKSTQIHPAMDSEATADQLYNQLTQARLEVLLDDRSESPGVKFNDADLIGIPMRITVSERSLAQGGVEYKRRSLPEKRIIPLDGVIPALQEEKATLEKYIAEGIVEVPPPPSK